jgi:transcriptional regulator with XRE-family HTH domain
VIKKEYLEYFIPKLEYFIPEYPKHTAMQPKTATTPHIGRKIERIRTIKGVKQDDLAAQIGMAQGTLSKIEQSEKVDDDKLKLIADALNVTPETIRNFNEDGPVNIIANTVNTHDQSALIFYNPTFNPIDKLLEIFDENKKLYERLLQSEREKNELLENLLKKNNGK